MGAPSTSRVRPCARLGDAPAQAQHTPLEGRVRDTSGAVIPGVTVTASSGSERRSVVTDREGRVTFATLAPGSYEIRAELVGFSPAITRGRLEAAALSESVTISRIRTSTGRSRRCPGCVSRPSRSAGMSNIIRCRAGATGCRSRTRARAMNLAPLTGACLVFYGVGSRVVHGLFLTTPPAAAAQQTVPATTLPTDRLALPLSLDGAERLAAGLLPGSRASSMYVSGPDGADVKVWLRSSGDIRPNVGSWHAWIDRTTGAVTAAMLPANTSVAAHANETWIIAIHYGTYGGEIVRLVYFAGGLVPVVLFFTGVIHWWVRRRRPQRASELSERNSPGARSDDSADLPGRR